MDERELIYVGDPMCSWCWGIAPQLDAVVERRSDLPMRLVLGGLRPGPNAREVDERFAASLAHHWDDVATRSGQPFDHRLLATGGWRYDTEPACKAVVVMRELDESHAWPLFKRVQRLFYADGIVPSGREQLEPVVASFDIDHDAYWTVYESETAVKQTWRDFAQVHKWGIGGFPTVLLRVGDRGHVVTRGFTTAAAMLAAIHRIVPVSGDMCDPDGAC